MKGSTLVAYGLIDAASTNIVLANHTALPLFDTKGSSIASGILPKGVSKVQFGNNVSKTFILGEKVGASTYEDVCLSQPDALDVFMSAQAVGVRAFDANITTGKFVVYFYA
jgi:hypothetical protein